MWISKKRWNALEKRVADLEKENQGRHLKPCEIKGRMAHIESLLQRMPELIASSYLIEKEKCENLPIGKKYSDTVLICPVEER